MSLLACAAGAILGLIAISILVLGSIGLGVIVWAWRKLNPPNAQVDRAGAVEPAQAPETTVAGSASNDLLGAAGQQVQP
jgi:hypothetical protein